MAAESSEQRWARRVNKLRHWHSAYVEQSSLVTHYNVSDELNPLIFFHGDWEGGGQYVRRIASLSGKPIVAIAPHGIHDNPAPATIEEMAADRLQQVLELRPKGPYRLGGYCVGGLVAYELAQMLSSAGHEVEVTVLIEPPSLNTSPPARLIYRSLEFLLKHTSENSTQQRARLQRAMGAVWQASRGLTLTAPQAWRLIRQKSAAKTGAGLSKGQADALSECPRVKAYSERNKALEALFDGASDLYLPKPLHSPVVVLSNGRDQADRFRVSFEGRFWKHVCSDFNHISLPGTHITWKSEHAGTIAGHLIALLP